MKKFILTLALLAFASSTYADTLVARLIGRNNNGTVMSEILDDRDRPKIGLHLFISLFAEAKAGRFTVATIKSHFSMDASDQTEFDLIYAARTAVDLETILLASECRCVSGYQTIAEVTGKLLP